MTTEPAVADATADNPTPAGHVRLADVLAVVRRYADNVDWCGDAEDTVEAALHDATGRTVLVAAWRCSCADCRAAYLKDRLTREAFVGDVAGWDPPRFTITSGPAFITTAQLDAAVGYAERRTQRSEWSAQHELFAELRATFLPVVAS